MDVETERVERTTSRSPKDKILVDSGDEEQESTLLNVEKQPTSLSDEVTALGDKNTKPIDDVPSDSSEGGQVLNVEQVGVTQSVSSDRHIIPAESELSIEGDEFSTDVTQAHETSASSSEPPAVTQVLNGEDRVSTSNAPEHETVAASEVHKASTPAKEEEETPVYAPSDNATFVSGKVHATTETLNVDDEKSAEVLPTCETTSEGSSDTNGRLVLTDKISSESKEQGQFESEHQQVTGLTSGGNQNECVDRKNVINSQEELGARGNGVCLSGLQEDVTQESSNAGIHLLEDTDACKEVHSNTQGSMRPTLDQLDDIKEPEEPDHATECRLLHNNEETTETQIKEDVSATVGKKEDEDGWIYVLGHDKLKKRVIKKGLENSRPVRGQVVTINCVGHLEDGSEVDKHDNWSLTLGEDEFIHAFDLCLAIMDNGETCEVVTDSRFAYGELGRDPEIPPNATISYIIELLEYHDQRQYSTLTVAERIQLSNEKRERGNYLYSRNEYSRSIDSYTRALKALDEDFESHGESPEELQEIIDTRIKCHNNMAAAQMKIGAWDVAAQSCDVVLKVQPDNVKALFRKGKCLANKGNISEAIPLLKRALKLEPETKIIHQELSRLERKNKVQTETEKALYQKMLGTDKDPPAAAAAKKRNEKASRWLWYVAGGAAAVLVSLGLTAYRYVHV